MSSAFAITTTTSAVDVVPGSPLAVQITVTNKTGRPVHALAKVVTTPVVPPAWVTLEPAGRPLENEQTEVFVVGLMVPPGTPPGSFTLRLDVIDRDNPDEHGTTGQVVTVRIPGSTPPVAVTRKPGGYLAAVVGTLLGTLLLAGAGLVLGLAILDSSVSDAEDFGGVLGDAIGGALMVLFTTIVGGYAGACLGCGVGLRVRKHVRPWRTAALQVVALPLWAVGVASLGSVANLSGDAVAWLLLVVTLALPPLACRALVVRTYRPSTTTVS